MDLIKGEEFYTFASFKRANKIELALFIDILNYLDTSFLPQPEQLHVVDKYPTNITSFTDDAIFKALGLSGGFELESDLLNVGTSITNGGYMGINISEKHTQQNVTIDNLKEFSLTFITKINPRFASAGFQKINDQIYEKYFGEDTEYEDEDIRSLHWLNYFGAEEFAKRGGEALYDNPHIEVKKMGEGVLVQIGESPYDAYTPEGEARLVAAIKAMPPYKRR